jgi:hypothetical protein
MASPSEAELERDMVILAVAVPRYFATLLQFRDCILTVSLLLIGEKVECLCH